MKEGRHDGVGVQAQLGHQMSHLQGVGDVGGAVLAQLPFVVGLGVLERIPYSHPVLFGEIFEFVFQLLIAYFQPVLHRQLPFLSSGGGVRPLPS